LRHSDAIDSSPSIDPISSTSAPAASAIVQGHPAQHAAGIPASAREATVEIQIPRDHPFGAVSLDGVLADDAAIEPRRSRDGGGHLVNRIDDESRASVIDEFRQRALPECNHWRAARHRLHRQERTRFGRGARNEQGACGTEQPPLAGEADGAEVGRTVATEPGRERFIETSFGHPRRSR
jgi:hypothetical protein